MTEKAEVRAEAERLRAAFESCGAEVFETDILQPAGALLDLYGEDIRARAFVTHDPMRGEMMLRPDFTMSLVRQHIEAQRGAARYTYAGEVFRAQEDAARASEYMQVGFEVLGEPPAAADAEVFRRFFALLSPFGLDAVMGDIGLLRAAVAGLKTSAVRKAALMRHLWRPKRFLALLARYSGPARPVPKMGGGVEIGLRSRDEVEDRLARLASDAEAPPVSREEIDLIETLLDVAGPAEAALAHLQGLALDMPAIAGSVAALEARFEALAAAKVPVSDLVFEASYGRTTLEYYDGFVFGFAAPGGDGRLIAGGGRYDALVRAMGGGDILAVGGVIRPGLLPGLAEGAT